MKKWRGSLRFGLGTLWVDPGDDNEAFQCDVRRAMTSGVEAQTFSGARLFCNAVGGCPRSSVFVVDLVAPSSTSAPGPWRNVRVLLVATACAAHEAPLVFVSM